MADRIIAALEYLDAHTSFVLQKSKHRSLGDIDSKYEIIDPTEMPLSAVIHDQINLLGIKRTNLSRQKTVDQILDEDRERIVQSAQRTRSAPSRKRIATSRPLTSSSNVGKTTKLNRRRNSPRPQSQMTSSSTSVTKMAFTRPGVDVGPSDARDEVMMEIVNKPLTHTSPKTRNTTYKTRPFTSTSLPGCGQVSVGCRSLNSHKRSQTSHGRPSPRAADNENKWDKTPGPFATVKVTGKDMWVVSDSTPPSYFNGDLNGFQSSKLPGWEETANSLPREEKKSVPRFERQLGAPPQFGPSSQWYSFAGKDPSKQQPILTSFTEKHADDYYNIESRVSETVINQLQSKAGIRIGVNGNVVSDSMKVVKKPQSETVTAGNDDISWDEEENQQTDFTSDAKTEDKASSSGKGASIESEPAEDEKEESELESDDRIEEKKDESGDAPREEDRQFTLLRFVGVANGENPYVANSSSTSTSSGNLSALLADIARNVKNAKNSDMELVADESVWKLLKESSPSFWISKEKWRKMREDLQRKKSKRVAEIADGSVFPLSWDEQLKQNDARVMETKSKNGTTNNLGENDSLPVVFHKLLSYDQLPTGFVHLTSSGYRPHSTMSRVDKDLDLTAPSKGCESTITTPPRSAKSRTTSAVNASQDGTFPGRPFTSQSLTKRSRLAANETGSLDLSQLLRVTQDSVTGKQFTSEADHVERTEGKHDDVSREELEAMRQEAAKSMKLTGHVHPKLLGSVGERLEAKQSASNQQQHQNRARSVTLNSLPMKSSSPITTVDIRPSVPKSSVPVSGLNLTDLDENYNVINGPNPPSPVSPIRMEEIFELANYAPLGTGTKFGVPANTPKTPKVPPTSSKLSSSDARSLLQDDRLPSSYESRSRAGNFRHGSKSASTLPRSNGSSPRNYPMQIAGDLPQHPPNRGFHGSPLTGRTQTGKAGQSRFGSTTKSFKTAAPGGLTGVDSINKQVEFPTRTGFIQISHSLHIPPQRPSSAKAEKRNKIYDSYMRELTSRTERGDKHKGLHPGKTNGVVVKSLGGTSGKILPDHQGGIKPQTAPAGGGNAKSKPNYSSFSAHAGLRSGLAIAGDISAPPVQQPKSNGGSVHLGLQGDQVRLNLDKNIHNIYRDLGILKKPGNGSGATSPQQSNIMTYEEVQVVNNGAKRNVKSAGRRSDGSRSRAHSAFSGDRVEDVASLHSVVTIPTAANSTYDCDDDDLNETVGDFVQHKEIERPNECMEDAPLTNQMEPLQAVDDKERRSSSAKRKTVKPNDMTDSGTQCNPTEMEPKDGVETSMPTNGVTAIVDTSANDEAVQPRSEEMQARMELDTGAVNMSLVKSETDEHSPETSIHETQAPFLPPQETPVNTENQNLPESDLQNVKPEGGAVALKEENKRPYEDLELKPMENDVSGVLADRRSLSESHLDRIGTDDDDVTDKGPEEDADVRGVTKVTVNIPAAVK